MNPLDREYWEQRWQSSQTGWDVGGISTPIKEYADQLSDKHKRILIPGCGSGHEAEYLFNQGFSNVHVLDVSPFAIKTFFERVPEFPVDNCHLEDFFTHYGPYDLVIEQTLFCALDPYLRQDYARHMHQLLVPGGKLAGLLFNFPLTSEGPPFGGGVEEYVKTFENYFRIRTLEEAYNSIAPRAGRELFIIMERLP